MTIVCRPYRLEPSESGLLLAARSESSKTIPIAHFVVAVAAGALAMGWVAVLVLEKILGERSDLLPDGLTPAFGFALAVLVLTVFARRADRQAGALTFPDHPEQTITISDDGIGVSNLWSDSTYRWVAFVRLIDRPEGLALVEPNGVALIVPDRAFPDALAREEARATIAAHLPA